MDEINRAVPRTQSSLLEVMEERTVTIAKQTHLLPEPFSNCNANPLESAGTFPLPDAQLDRFYSQYAKVILREKLKRK